MDQTLADLSGDGITLLSRFSVIPAVTVDVPDAALSSLSTLPSRFPAIELIEEDKTVTTMPGPVIVSNTNDK